MHAMETVLHPMRGVFSAPEVDRTFGLEMASFFAVHSRGLTLLRAY